MTRFQHARAFFLGASCWYFLLTHRCGALCWLSRRSEGRVLAHRPGETPLAQGTALIGGKLTGPYVTYFDRKNSLSHRRVPPPASVRRWSCCSRIWRTTMSTKIALITYIEVLFMP